jgi:hypothetical protein
VTSDQAPTPAQAGETTAPGRNGEARPAAGADRAGAASGRIDHTDTATRKGGPSAAAQKVARPAKASAPPARRPTSLDPRELGFTPRPPVPWLGPTLLLSTGLRTLLAELFGA